MFRLMQSVYMPYKDFLNIFLLHIITRIAYFAKKIG